MSENPGLLQQLEFAVSEGSPHSRLKALSYTTDLLTTGRYTEKETWVFGEVIALLASEIEVSARADLARRLAPSRNAPRNIIHKLASDDSIDVAGPILRHSEQFDVQTLVGLAQSKSQAHLLAISQRKSLPEDVTDVLVARGDSETLHSVARNVGARFSESGFWHLVKRSEDDILLAVDVGSRKDIPRHQFQKLIAKASDEAKARLVAANPGAAAEIGRIVTVVTGQVQTRFGPGTRDYFGAKRTVGAIFKAGKLTEQMIGEFAKAGKFEQTTVALSLVCNLPVDIAERALLDDHGEMVLIVMKAANLSWATSKLILTMCREGCVSIHDADQDLKNFSTISVATARKVMEFYRLRNDPDNSRAPAGKYS